MRQSGEQTTHEEPIMTPQSVTATSGSHDGTGTGDHDVPFVFGRRPRAVAPYPFSTHQYIRLLVLRSKVEAGLVGSDDQGVAWRSRGLPG
jgi:hypothetical protein